jgi:hypothetical protein
LLCVLTLFVIRYFALTGGFIAYLNKTIAHLPAQDMGFLFKLGIGDAQPQALMGLGEPNGWKRLMVFIMIANAIQPVVSSIYFAYNSFFTNLFVALEFSAFGAVRKGLRVSEVPEGAQRSTYFLQLPYRVGIPLMVMSFLVHWLVSRSIFLVNIDSYDYSGPDDTVRFTGSQFSCGYSPLAIILVIVLSFFIFAFLLWFSAKRFGSHMPIAATCSAAISATCHPPKIMADPDSAAHYEVMWGDTGDQDGLGHASFSRHYVGPLVEGKLYS